MAGRKFTRYKPNGFVKSKIDRVLVSKEWLDIWSESKQFVLSKSVSDHRSIILKDSTVDLVPKLFRCLAK